MKHLNGAAIALLALAAGGCLGPKVVGQITSRGDHVKFVYSQVGFMTFKQGVIECKADPKGDTSECVEKPIVFKE